MHESLLDEGFVHFDPSFFSIYLPYATPENVTGEQLYINHACYVKKEVYEALVGVNKELQKKDYRLHIWDAYRPFHIQEKLWAFCPDDRYIARPVRKDGKMVSGSNHSRGKAVDLTIVDGNLNYLSMPSGFDDLSEKAWRTPEKWSNEIRENMELFETLMIKNGFKANPNEWWHYDFLGEVQKDQLYDVELPDIDNSTLPPHKA